MYRMFGRAFSPVPRNPDAEKASILNPVREDADNKKEESEKEKKAADKEEADKKPADKEEADKKEAETKEAGTKEAGTKEADKKEAETKEADKNGLGKIKKMMPGFVSNLLCGSKEDDNKKEEKPKVGGRTKRRSWCSFKRATQRCGVRRRSWRKRRWVNYSPLE
jgi:hypothetical protein